MTDNNPRDLTANDLWEATKFSAEEVSQAIHETALARWRTEQLCDIVESIVRLAEGSGIMITSISSPTYLNKN